MAATETIVEPLEVLLRRAASVQMTPAQIREQRVSFVYGQMASDPSVSREQVRQWLALSYGDSGTQI